MACACQRRAPGALVVRGWRDFCQPLPFQRAQEPAQIPGIETKARAKSLHVDAVGANFEKNARFAQRSVTAEIAVVEGADGLADGAVEAPDFRYARVKRYLTLVR